MTRIHPAKKVRLEAEEAEKQRLAGEKERLQKQIVAMEKQEAGLHKKKLALFNAVHDALEKSRNATKALYPLFELIELARLIAPEEVAALVTELDPLTERHLAARNEVRETGYAFQKIQKEVEGVSRALWSARLALRNKSDELRFAGQALAA